MFSSTIKPYKFVNPSLITAGRGATIMAGGKTITGSVTPDVLSARKVLLSMNRVGQSLHSLGQVQMQMRDMIQSDNKYLSGLSNFNRKREQYRRDQKSEERQESTSKKQNEAVAKEAKEEGKRKLSWLDKLLGPFAGLIAFAGKIIIQQTVLRWLADPGSTKSVVSFVTAFGKIFGIAFKLAYKSIDSSLTGFSRVFGSSDKKGLDRFGEVLGGLGQILVGIAGFKALGYLLNPFSLVSDIAGALDLIDSAGGKGKGASGGKKTPPKKLPGGKSYRAAKSGMMRGTSKVFGKGIAKVLGRIPFVGPILDFGINLLLGEPIGKAAAKAVGATALGALGGMLGSVVPFAGTFLGGLAGGIAGDFLGGAIYDLLEPLIAKKQPAMAEGGLVTKPTRALIGERGPELVIPLGMLGGLTAGGTVGTIIAATQSAMERMGASGELAKQLIGGDLVAAAEEFGVSTTGKKSAGDSLGKSVVKSKRTDLSLGGEGVSKYFGEKGITVAKTISPVNDMNTLRGGLANLLSVFMYLTDQNFTSPGGGPSPTNPSGDTSGDFSGSVNAEKAFNYFKSKGLTAEQAAGIVGNFMQEAGPKIDPTIANSIGHRGIAQWDPRDRWPKLVRFARSKNLNPETLEAQLQFVWHELETGDGGLSLTTLKSAKTVQQAAHLFVKNYERSGEEPGHPGYDNRITYGNQVYNKYAKMASGGRIERYNKEEQKRLQIPTYKEASSAPFISGWKEFSRGGLVKFAAGGKFPNGRLPDSELQPVKGYGRTVTGKMHKTVAKQFQAMIDSAKKQGHSIGINSTYRSYEDQVRIKREMGRLAAAPGTSNHGFGLAADLNYSNDGYKWLWSNAGKFGFGPLSGWGLSPNTPDAPEAWHWENTSGKGSIEGATDPNTNPSSPTQEAAPVDPWQTFKEAFDKFNKAMFPNLADESEGKLPEEKTKPTAKVSPVYNLKPATEHQEKYQKIGQLSQELEMNNEQMQMAFTSPMIIPINTSSGIQPVVQNPQVLRPKAPITYGFS